MSQSLFTFVRRVCQFRVPLLVLCLVCGIEPAAAQVSSDKAAAEALFDEGVALLKDGKYPEACKKLEASQRVDPGIGTLLYIGECYERLGRTASAWATFREAASKAEATGQSDRAEVGTERAEALEPLLSYVTIHMATENEGIEGLEVLETNKPVNRALWGTPFPVDPGDLQVVVQAPGYESFRAQITIEAESKDNSLEIPALVALPTEVAEEEPNAPATVEDAPASNTQRTMGWVFGTAGVVGLGVGTVFGILAINKNDKAKPLCPNNVCDPSSQGLELTNTARAFAATSTAGFIAGGVLLATGAVLLITAPKKQRSARLSVSPTLGGAHFALGGEF